jgi:hypothetical protein
VSDVRWIQVGNEHNCWKINTRSMVYDRNKDKESLSEADDEEEDLEENLENSRRKPEKEAESGKPSTPEATSGSRNLIDTPKEVPKGHKAVIDLANPDKVHLDKGASKVEVELPDVAKEVEDHLKRSARRSQSGKRV